MAVIDCKHVSIKYIAGDIKAIGLKEYIIRRLTNNYHVVEFWADNDITFKIEKGDMLGIIGSNGAGKSTLLKAITGIMKPAEGKVKVNGTIAALLELASGFDNEMTVKENVYLRGAMLGYTKSFLDQKYNEIIEFAELQSFEDYAFKQLSSGMKSRLAFSIACLVEPDILILDEVLSVGDGAFRKKSGDKMREILSSGVTCILVSHSIDQIAELCNKVLWIDKGRQVLFSDDVENVCDAYNEFSLTKELPQDHDDVLRMAGSYRVRQNSEEEEKRRKRLSRIVKNLDKYNDEDLLGVAYEILQKARPKLYDMIMEREDHDKYVEDANEVIPERKDHEQYESDDV